MFCFSDTRLAFLWRSGGIETLTGLACFSLLTLGLAMPQHLPPSVTSKDKN
jgi:hypothetical protein